MTEIREKGAVDVRKQARDRALLSSATMVYETAKHDAEVWRRVVTVLSKRNEDETYLKSRAKVAYWRLTEEAEAIRTAFPEIGQ